jgi:hypothetical protein
MSQVATDGGLLFEGYAASQLHTTHVHMMKLLVWVLCYMGQCHQVSLPVTPTCVYLSGERVLPARRGAADFPLSAVPQHALTPRSSIGGAAGPEAVGGMYTPAAGSTYTPVKPVS